MPPLGLLSIAATLRMKCKNAQIEIIDYEAGSWLKHPDYSRYDIVGITGTTVHMPHIKELVSDVRKENPTVCIVLGGAHATFAYAKLLDDLPEVDVIIRGEGELAFADFVYSYRTRANIPIIPGVMCRTSKNIDSGEVIQDLDECPDYAYDLVQLSKYQLSTHRRYLEPPFASMMTSRGCPFSCAYCQTPAMFGSHIRYRSSKLVAEEIKRLIQDYSIRSVVFWDDTFTSNRSYTMELCDSIKDLGIKWMCNTRVDRVDADMLSAMKRAGCESIFFGVESFYESTLANLGRKARNADVEYAFSTCNNIGIKTVAAIMIGMPGEDLTCIEESINKLIELNPTDVYISIYNVTVGSKEYERAKKSGLLDLKEDWYNPNSFVGPPFGLPTVSNLSRFDLQKIQKFAYRKFYGKDGEEPI